MLQIVSQIKERMLTVRLTPEVLAEYKIAARLKGSSMSNLVHMYIFQVIREQKERNPEAFKNEFERPVVRAKIRRTKGKSKQNKG